MAIKPMTDERQHEIDDKRVPVVIIQFAKWPVKGRVKTRLAKTMGDEAALAAHKLLTTVVYQNLSRADIGFLECWFDCLPEGSPIDFMGDEFLKNATPLMLQVGRDLGERMRHALILRLSQADKVLLVGSDCPAVCSDYLHEACLALEHHDAVLGPAEDGGYVLIGVSRRILSKLVSIEGNRDRFLSQISWGSASVLEETLENFKQCKVSYQLLPELWDVDDESDWQRFQDLPRKSG
jgi:hypothetical protein